jgi:predicted metal-dependent enzyme (double-stranded beta helix superfamily)
MTSKRTWAILLAAVGAAAYVGSVLATPSTGFTSTTIAKAQLGELNTKVHSVPADWHAMIQTKGLSDLYVQSNVFAPGGSSGWHTHPGPSLITVTAGAVTVYDGDDPSCTPHVYSATGTNGFVDVGGGDVHLIRNEGSEEARTVVVQLIPTGAARRIDAPAPGNCPF